MAVLLGEFGPAPRFAVVRDTNPARGEIVLDKMMAYIEVVPVKQAVNVNGQAAERTVFVSVSRMKWATLDARASCVITPDGKQLPIDEVWKRLQPNTVFMISGGLERPAPQYLRALNPRTLVFIPGPAKQ
jgi:hypothetical protein